eukprot:3419866-Ditylum_brightwellii.AAC.1
MENLIFLTEKQDKAVKVQACTNGSTQHRYIAREETASPTTATEAILVTGVIKAKQQRNIMMLDIPNVFVQTPLLQTGDKIIMKIRGLSVEGKQHTVPWRVDNVKSSHGELKVNDKFHKWCKRKYGSKALGHVKVVRGKKHDYLLSMTLDYSQPTLLVGLRNK